MTSPRPSDASLGLLADILAAADALRRFDGSTLGVLIANRYLYRQDADPDMHVRVCTVATAAAALVATLLDDEVTALSCRLGTECTSRACSLAIGLVRVGAQRDTKAAAALVAGLGAATIIEAGGILMAGVASLYPWELGAEPVTCRVCGRSHSMLAVADAMVLTGGRLVCRSCARRDG